MKIKHPSPSSEAYFPYLERTFSVPVPYLREIISSFHSEMERGLSGKKSSLKMLPSFVDTAKGKETGEFMALDLGGTHFRVLRVHLNGAGKSSVLGSRQFAVPETTMNGTSEALFDFMAERIDAFIQENQFNSTEKFDLAFTFSFPVTQSGIRSGKLLYWTKGFTATGVVGNDVVAMLNDALIRKKVTSVHVTALANDTVGTLVARSYEDPACDMAVIMGTGTNACYREERVRISKLCPRNRTGKMIVNMEWGNFDQVNQTAYDRDLDRLSVNPGAMFFEKMVSGMYLGEIVRLVLLDLTYCGFIFNQDIKARYILEKKEALNTRDLSLIEADESRDLQSITGVLEDLGFLATSLGDRQILKHLCKIISSRAAAMIAAAISAVMTWMDPELNRRHTVSIDGSLYEKYNGFEKRINQVLGTLHGHKAKNINLVHSRDGSGVGAAIIAAVATSSEQFNCGLQYKKVI